MYTPRRKPMAEINVVPYIDVMLVLLVIFMATAPLLNLGVEIDLPEGDAATLPQANEPLVVNIAANGDWYLTIDGESELIDPQTLGTKVAAFVRRNPDMPVMVGADRNVDYQQVYGAMVVLQEAGVDKVGLVGEPPAPLVDDA